MNERVWMQSIALAWMTAGCGLMGGGGGGAGATTPANAPAGGAPTSGGAAAAPGPDAELRAMVTEALTPQLCPKLLGSYVGLPGESDARGPAAGATASVGRWWIRRCEARTVGDRMELSIGGSGWTWIDRETGGFRVRQYLLFDASASLGADVTVGYDRARRVASLWMTPAAGVQATITPRGLVNVEPQGFFASVLGGVAAATGASVSERASTQAAELGSTQLRDRLAQALRRLQQRLRRLRKLGGRLGRYAQRLLARLSRLGLPPLGGRTHGAHKGVEAQSKHELALAGDEGRGGRHLRPADGRLVSCESDPCEEGLRQRRVLVPRHELGRELKAPLGCRARLVAPRVEEGLDEQLGLAGELCQHAHVRVLALLLAAPHESRPREPAAREQAVLCA
jgi:hypothetical protein